MSTNRANRLGTGLYPCYINSIRIDRETHRELLVIAKELKTSPAETIRTVLEWGLQSHKDGASK